MLELVVLSDKLNKVLRLYSRLSHNLNSRDYMTYMQIQIDVSTNQCNHLIHLNIDINKMPIIQLETSTILSKISKSTQLLGYSFTVYLIYLIPFNKIYIVRLFAMEFINLHCI